MNIISSLQLTPALKALPGKTGEDNSWLPAWIHMTDTAGIMDKLLRHWIPDGFCQSAGLTWDVIYRISIFLALVHDIGKMTVVFCARISQMRSDFIEKLTANGIEIPEYHTMKNATKSPHTLAGAAILKHYGIPDGIIAVVGAHHGKPMSGEDELYLEEQIEMYPQNYGFTKASPNSKKQWQAIWKEWIQIALELSGFQSIDELPDLSEKAQMILCGLLITADWIASNTRFYPLWDDRVTSEQEFIDDRTEFAWSKLQFPDNSISETYFYDDELFFERFHFHYNDVQREMLSAVTDAIEPGVYILEAQMGVGKTEAALAAAEVLAAKTQRSGFFFGLPTQATANGVFPRILSWAEQSSNELVKAVRLAHGMANFNDQYCSLFQGHGNVMDEQDNGIIVHSWFEGRKQALLANIVVGTVDQLLLAALKQKHVMLRHLGLVNKVVIIDECHAYDAYMNHYLNRILQWLGQYHVPVILLSATLPAKQRNDFIQAYTGIKSTEVQTMQHEYPLLTWSDGKIVYQKPIRLTNVQRKNVAIGSLSDDNLIAMIETKLNDGGCLGIIVNTVRRAQVFAKMLRTAFPKRKILLFHSQFTASDRIERENELMRLLGKQSESVERNGVIVIGTQVLEQSLDIDFDMLVTDLCPMDLLIQRIGRLHRHSGRIRPESGRQPQCYILGLSEKDFEAGSKAVYGAWFLERTRELLPESIIIPDDIPQLVQETYRDPVEQELRPSYSDYCLLREQKKQRASMFCIRKCVSGDNQLYNSGINRLLDTDWNGDEKHAEAAVRDGDPTISVLVMIEHADGMIGFLPWLDNDTRLSASHVPSDEEYRKIAAQILRLPHTVAQRWQLDTVIQELENRNRERLSEWQQSPWLHGELILLLDENLYTSMCGYRLFYSKNDGLQYEKEE